ncbi:hypothetical protein MRB53_031684 [Persea americana]|uniref:Uncharacterized protein n=1 Tax=Persea americana TaxID=3435 RepID=A0ACC2KQ58_PERAE|nr:hypothetical protein MRB53_031684 [Persea americana]
MAKSSNLQKWELTQNSIPDDIAFNIVSFLSASDVCSLGCCSRFWRDLCASDFIWISLSKQRWPSFDLYKMNQDSNDQHVITQPTNAEDVMNALSSCQISERQVCVRWWKLGRWFHGFRLRDESRSRRVSLGALAVAKENEVMAVLHRGAIHEVLRVQILAEPAITAWTCWHSEG